MDSSFARDLYVPDGLRIMAYFGVVALLTALVVGPCSCWCGVRVSHAPAVTTVVTTAVTTTTEDNR